MHCQHAGNGLVYIPICWEWMMWNNGNSGLIGNQALRTGAGCSTHLSSAWLCSSVGQSAELKPRRSMGRCHPQPRNFHECRGHASIANKFQAIHGKFRRYSLTVKQPPRNGQLTVRLCLPALRMKGYFFPSTDD